MLIKLPINYQDENAENEIMAKTKTKYIDNIDINNYKLDKLLGRD